MPLFRVIYFFFITKGHCGTWKVRQLLTAQRDMRTPLWYPQILWDPLPCKWRRIVDAYPPNCTALPSLDLSTLSVCKHELGHCKCKWRSDVSLCESCYFLGGFIDLALLGQRLLGADFTTLHLFEAGRTQHSFSKLHVHSLSTLQPLVGLFTLLTWYKVSSFFIFIYERTQILSCSVLYEMSMSLPSGMLV
jgi:hypothetical protein